MLKRTRKSLKIKLLMLFFVLNFSVILLVGFISYQSKRAAIVEQAENHLSYVASELSQDVDIFLNQRLSETRAIALHYSLHGLSTTTSNQNRLLADYLSIYPYYEHISIINVEDIRQPKPEGRTSAGYSRTWYLPAMNGAATSSDMYISPITDKPTMSFAAPVTDPNGRVVSILTANLKLGYLWDVVDKLGQENRKNGFTGYAYLVNHEGFLIAHPRREKVFKDNLLNTKDANIKKVARDMTSGVSGVGSYTYEGIAKLVAYSPCEGYGDYKGHGWSLAVTKDYSELLQPMKHLLHIYLALFLFTSLAVLLVSNQLANYLVRPILALKDGAASIGAGNFAMRIQTDAEDEIGDLAKSFNLMAEALETRENQIDEYMFSLTKMNRELQLKQEELGQANEFLKKTNDELVKLEKQKAEFNAMITHDIKSPLSAIITYTEMILDGTITLEGDELEKAVSNIHASGYKILTLVENYLVSSAIEAGKLQLNLQPLYVNDLIEDSLPLFTPQAERKNMTLNFVGADSLPPVMADKVQLDRAISNLVNNAIKFGPSDSEITITARMNETGLAVSVADKGKGITEEDIKNLFNKYSRSKDSARIVGTGLGLFISKAITEAHGGSITVQSKVGEGSTFTIHLPAMKK